MVPKILIVEDDRDDLFFLTEALKTVDPQAVIIPLKNGSEALSHLDITCKGPVSNIPDLIFMDLNMPLLDGRIASKIMKQSVEYCKIPVIILTTSENEKEREDLMQQGANSFYTKPSSMPELIEIVKEVFSTYLPKVRSL